MLSSVDGRVVTAIPHARDFQNITRRLGPIRADAVRVELNRIVDNLPPDRETNRRTFSSTILGSKLTPWPYPIAHIYDVAREIEGEAATEQQVQDRSALIFGIFVWECIMNRDEEWVFYDPNLSSRDPNRDITGKVYFEQNT